MIPSTSNILHGGKECGVSNFFILTIKETNLLPSGIAKAFLGGQALHLEDLNKEKVIQTGRENEK